LLLDKNIAGESLFYGMFKHPETDSDIKTIHPGETMLIKLGELISLYKLRISGVIHIGAHYGDISARYLLCNNQLNIGIDHNHRVAPIQINGNLNEVHSCHGGSISTHTSPYRLTLTTFQNCVQLIHKLKQHWQLGRMV